MANVAKQRMPFGRISSRNALRMSPTDVVKQRMPSGRISTRNASRMSATIIMEIELDRKVYISRLLKSMIQHTLQI
jgi:hypothetical protein